MTRTGFDPMIFDMAGIAMRGGLWGIVLVLALFLFADRQGGDGLLAELIQDGILMLIAQISIGLLVLGGILSVVPKIRLSKPKCKECGTKVDPGYLYCRRHLNMMLETEDNRRRTLNVRRPDV